MRTLPISAKECGAAVIVAAFGSASVGGALRAIDPTAGTILTIGSPITLCGNEKRGRNAFTQRGHHLTPDRLAPLSNLVGRVGSNKERTGQRPWSVPKATKPLIRLQVGASPGGSPITVDSFVVGLPTDPEKT